jgi:hypothetical protein
MTPNVELKEKLIEKINNTDDAELLEELLLLFDLESKTEEVYKLGQEEEEAVNEGIYQLKNGLFVSNEESNRRADEWLKKYDGR